MLKNLRRPDWTTDSSATAVVCVVIVDVVIKICQPTLTLTSAYLRKPIFAYLKELFILYQYVSISYFSDSHPPPRNHRVQLIKKFNSITAPPSTPDFSLFPHNKHPPSQLHATMWLPNKKHRISVRVVQPWPF